MTNIPAAYSAALSRLKRECPAEFERLYVDELTQRGLTPKFRRGQARAHGTYGGYIKHTEQRTPPCDECRAAHATYARERRAKAKGQGDA